MGAVGSRWLNHLLAFARNSPLSNYNSTASLLGDALADDFAFPPVWAEWRDLAERFGLDTKYTMTKLLPVVHWRALQCWFQPFEHSALIFTEIHMRAGVLPDPAAAADLWEATVLASASMVEGSEISLRGAPHDAGAIVTRAHAASLQAPTATLDVSKMALSAPTHADFLRLGHSARLKAFSHANTPRDSLLNFSPGRPEA